MQTERFGRSPIASVAPSASFAERCQQRLGLRIAGGSFGFLSKPQRTKSRHILSDGNAVRFVLSQCLDALFGSLTLPLTQGLSLETKRFDIHSVYIGTQRKNATFGEIAPK